MAIFTILVLAQFGCEHKSPSDASSNLSNTVTWSQTNGPLGFGGKLTSVIVNRDGDIFVGSEDAGILELKKNESIWQLANEGISSFHILSLAKNANGHLFAGTTNGIFRSIDNGVTWQDLSDKIRTNRPSRWVRFIAIDSNDNVVASVWDEGLYRSTDNGDSWQYIGLTSKLIQCVAFGVNGYIYAGDESLNGIFRSVDNAQSWTAINDGIRPGSEIGSMPRVFALEVNSQGLIFAAAENGIYISTNDGGLWKGIFSPARSLAINSKDHVFAGGVNAIFRSKDNGETWIDSIIPNVVSLAFDANENIFAASARKGLYQSTDNGESWSQFEVAVPVQVSALAFRNSGQIYAATTKDGFFVSSDQGDTWLKLNKNFLLENVNSLGVNPDGDIFVTTIFDGIFRSQDNGQTWTNVTPQTISIIGHPRILSLAVTETGILFVATESNGVLRSTNNGDDWRETNNGLDYIVKELEAAVPVGPLALDSRGNLYVGTARGSVFVSLDDGDNWSKIGGVIGGTPISAIAVNSQQLVFVGTLQPARVFRMPGTNPQASEPDEVYTGVGNGQVLSIAIDGHDYIYVSTNETPQSIYLSSDTGETWIQINAGLRNAQVNTIGIGPNDDVYAGTSKGVFKAKQLSN